MATIRKRGAKFQVQVRRSGLKSVSKSFHSLADARKWARQKEVEADADDLPPNRASLRVTTLADLVVRYRDTIVPQLRSAGNETIYLNAFLRHPICQRTLHELNSADFALYRDERLKSVSAKSLKRMLSPINHMFDVARDEWLIPIKSNPARTLRLAVIDDRRQRRLREGEWPRLLTASRSTKNQYVMLVARFALETAMRRGEILSLRALDIDEQHQLASVRQSKNGHPRQIPLTSEALQIVAEARSISSLDALYPHHVALPDDERLIFPISANGLRLAWERLLRRAGIVDLHFHDLRHEAISRLFELGLSVPEAASISGHRTLTMLMRYSHANDKSVRIKMGIRDR